MKPEDDAPLTIDKWPFYLGDVLLVLTALLIALLGEWNLSMGEIFACVLSVALGAGLFVLPYLYEYTMRLKEESGDLEASLRVLVRQIKHIESRMAELDRQINRKNDEPGFKKSIESLEQQLGDLQAVEKKKKADAKVLTSLVSQLDGIEKRIQELATVPEDPVSKVESPTQKNLPKKNNLLQRAMSEKQEPNLQAVSRIIEAVPGEPLNEVAEEDASEGATKTETEGKPQREADSENTPSEPEADLSEDPVEESVLEDKANDSESLEADTTLESLEVDTEPDTEPMEEIPSSTELFGGLVDSNSPKKRKRKGKKDTVLTVNALIGIGNKPYLRGSGAGLSWEAGQPMEFQSIGKWEWTVPETFEDAIEVQVYCNDQDPDKGGKHMLEAGEKLEINPKF